jgi:uncharacterized protein YjbI with pentapeptide repeats
MTTTFLDTLNSLLPTPKDFHRIAYSDTTNLPTYLTPTDPHDFAYDYTAGVLMVKSGGAWTTVDQTKTFIFKEYTVNCVPPDPYYGIAYNGIPDIDWPPELHWGSIYVSDSWTPILASNAHTGELAVINELTHMLAMTPAGIKLNWAELDQSPTGSGGFVHENDPTINRPILVTAVLTNPTLTDALMTDSVIERTLALTTTLDDPTILTGTLTSSTIDTPIVTGGTFSSPVISTATINNAESHDEMSYDATLFTAQITNGTLDTAILNSPNLNTATITSSLLDDVVITSATISSSALNDSNITDAIIATSSMSGSYIYTTEIDTSTVNGATINDAIISTSNISFTNATDITMVDSTMGNSTITTASMNSSSIETTSIDASTVSSSTITSSTVDDVVITNSTMSGSIIDSTSIYTATVNNSTIDNATISSTTVTGSNVNDVIIITSTMSDSSINTTSMVNSSIANTAIGTSTVDGSTITDAIISTSAISFTTITDVTINDAIINSTVLNSPELVTPDLGTPTSGDLSNCTFPIATDADLGSVMVDNDSITISGTGTITASSTRVVKELVRNTSGATIVKGQPVYISGSNGIDITVSLAQANSDLTSSKTLGIVESNISNGATGYVIVQGMLQGLNTISASAAGDSIWLSPSTPGGFVYGIVNKPVAPNHAVYLGVVSRKNAVSGEIFIKVENGYEIGELHDVLVTAPTDGQIISYEASTSLWKNKTLSSQANSWNASQSFTGTAASLATVFTNTSEVVTVSNTAANNTVVFDVTTQAIVYYTANATGNWTVNFRASSGTTLNAAMVVGQSVTASFLVTQGSTAYYNAAVQIDGVSVTPKYQGVTSITSGNANGIDMYTYTIIKTGAATFTVLMSLTNFG